MIKHDNHRYCEDCWDIHCYTMQCVDRLCPSCGKNECVSDTHMPDCELQPQNDKPLVFEYGPPTFACDPACPDYQPTHRLDPEGHDAWMYNRHCSGCAEHVRNPDENHMVNVHNAKRFSDG